MRGIGKRVVRSVSGSRWFPGVVTVVVLLGAFAVAGLAWAGTPPSGAGDVPVPALSIRMQITEPGAPRVGGEWIELESYQWGVARPMSGGLPSGNLQATAFAITKTVDAASPKLFQYCADGTHLPKVEIQVGRGPAAARTFMTFTLEDAMISGYSLSSGGDRPMESITFVYEKMTVKYIEQDKETGLVCTDWRGLWNYSSACTG